ncbi:SDR family oxidoreductase [Marinicella gelatinilytica]|uniref:SDR family oxidoreductase n=1 Tax=Marinicella gelatinilytica TaxID=2996017 RepID=UPI002260CF75|nr:SDR family oxidoreductase [Marinicella gelatinilytica]MCX7544470.1 SDR family oxidoreductase [Marinicella gelatinilytica]
MSTLLILGAKSDIARAVAQQYAAKGYDLLLAGRSINELDDFAKDLTIRNEIKVSLHEFDANDFASHASFIEQLPQLPNGVITAIGYLGDQQQAQQDWTETEKIMTQNLLGNVSVLNILANLFAERQSGFIIGISSVAGDRGRQKNYMYGAAKAGFTTYLSGLRNRLFKNNVHVLTVKPGFVNTQMTADMDLPDKLTAEPEQVAKDIYKAQQKNKNTLYTKGIWAWIMRIIRLIPEWQFKKMDL